MKVPFVDIHTQHAPLRQAFDEAISRVLDTGAFTLGPEVEAFEEAFASYCGVSHCVGVSSGTNALMAALKALGVGPDDEVITVSHTFFATAEAISHVGAKPVFVDIDPGTYNMSPELAEAAIGPKTKAVVVVHLYGQVADMNAFVKMAEDHGLGLIEDACQAHGASYAGKRAGSFGHAACFSFYPSKNLGAAGEAGCVVTDDSSIAAAIRMLRDHGQVKKHLHGKIGYNFRMAAFQGAVLRIKLPHLDSWNKARIACAARYEALLGKLPLVLPKARTVGEHVYHLYVVCTEARDALRDALQEAGVATGLHYPVPIHLQPAYAHLDYEVGTLPVTERVASQGLSLPIYPELGEAQQVYVAKHIEDFFEDR
jgi:dTDP-4-amino-4,6-dideoxygalactose transaminase